MQSHVAVTIDDCDSAQDAPVTESVCGRQQQRGSHPALVPRTRSDDDPAPSIGAASRSEAALDRLGIDRRPGTPPSSPPRPYLCSPGFTRTASVLVGRRHPDLKQELQRHDKVRACVCVCACVRVCDLQRLLCEKQTAACIACCVGMFVRVRVYVLISLSWFAHLLVCARASLPVCA